MGIPADSRRFLRYLQEEAARFYQSYPKPDACHVSADGIRAYTRLAGRVVSRLRHGDLALARYLVYKQSKDSQLFSDMGDKELLCAAEALCGAYGTQREEKRALNVTYDYMDDLQNEDTCEYPLMERWMDLGMSRNYRLQKKWWGALSVNFFLRLHGGSCYPEYLPEKRRIPSESQRRIEQLQRRLRRFCRQYPLPNTGKLPDDGIDSYIQLSRPVIRCLKDGDLGLAQYIVYGMTEEGSFFSAVGDHFAEVSALALVGAYSSGKERKRIGQRIEHILSDLYVPASPIDIREQKLEIDIFRKSEMEAMRWNLRERFGLDWEENDEKQFIVAAGTSV